MTKHILVLFSVHISNCTKTLVSFTRLCGNVRTQFGRQVDTFSSRTSRKKLQHSAHGKFCGSFDNNILVCFLFKV